MIERALALATAHPHDFTLQYPPRREYFQDCFRGSGRVEDARLLYVHVPFCAHRCSYCNFAVDLSADEARMERYVDALVARIGRVRAAEAIDIGGGTPTRLPPHLLRRLVGSLARFGAPISIETTPEIAATRPDVLDALEGVDRVSVGLQSSAGDALSIAGRPDAALHARALEALRRFRRINVDLVFGLPGQADWAADVRHAIALAPDAITTYDCLYRGKGRAMTRRSLQAPSPEAYASLYEEGRALLRAAGYDAPYGAMTYSRHRGETGTSVYFERRLLDGFSYLGVGNYATSHQGDLWTFENASVDRFLRGASGDAYVLPRDETIAKYVLLSLSFGFLDPARYRARFGEELGDRFPMRFAVERGWLTESYGVASFGDLPKLRSLFYTPRAIAWLARAREQQAIARPEPRA